MKKQVIFLPKLSASATPGKRTKENIFLLFSFFVGLIIVYQNYFVKVDRILMYYYVILPRIADFLIWCQSLSFFCFLLFLLLVTIRLASRANEVFTWWHVVQDDEFNHFFEMSEYGYSGHVELNSREFEQLPNSFFFAEYMEDDQEEHEHFEVIIPDDSDFTVMNFERPINHWDFYYNLIDSLLAEDDDVEGYDEFLDNLNEQQQSAMRMHDKEKPVWELKSALWGGDFVYLSGGQYPHTAYTAHVLQEYQRMEYFPLGHLVDDLYPLAAPYRHEHVIFDRHMYSMKSDSFII